MHSGLAVEDNNTMIATAAANKINYTYRLSHLGKWTSCPTSSCCLEMVHVLSKTAAHLYEELSVCSYTLSTEHDAYSIRGMYAHSQGGD